MLGRPLLPSLLVPLCLLLATAPLGATAPEIANPDLFEKSLKAAQQALEYYGTYDNPAELRRVADIGYRIAQESSFRKFPFSFYLVDMPVPNAFALPGGQIFLTKGMLDLGLNDDMLAGLLGHEIGHVVLEHGLRIQKRATLLNVLSQALLIGVIVAADSNRETGVPAPYDPYGRGNRGGTDRVMGAAAAGIVVSELLLRSYSREFEDEADEEGQRLAAGAGFDPDGTRQLMAKMRARLPESKEYGYWRTHPFFDLRVRAAEVREGLLKVQEPKPADAFRRATQDTLLGFVDRPKLDDPMRGMLRESALTAWPRGAAADAYRLEKLHKLRSAELLKPPLSRNYGALLAAYERVREEVETVDPGSRLLATLAEETTGFKATLTDLYPDAVEVFRRGIFETDFLESFASNYPTAPELPEIALALGDSYSRLGRPADAVSQYLRAWTEAPGSEAGQQAREGLRNLTPALDRLAALQELASQDRDGELQRLAESRLVTVAGSYKDLANGASYLKKHPDSPHAETVSKRLNGLADNLYGEVVLYQAVGDHAKALDRIQRILTQAPLSPAAERLRQSAVLES